MSTLPPWAPVNDTIGRITVPVPGHSGAVWTLVSEYGYGMTRDWRIVEHRFGYPATMGIQRFSVGSGARRFQFVKTALTYKDKQTLIDFFDATQGCNLSFTYPAPTSDLNSMTGGMTNFQNHEVVFDTPPVSITDLSNRAQTGLTFLEIINPYAQSVYTVSGEPLIRFPTPAMAAALADQVQTIIPLVHIKVRNTQVPDIYLSDRRVVINGFPSAPSPQTFLPRLLNIGVPGMADVMMSQSIDGRADNVSFRLGNADRVMTQLVADCSLEFAQIDLNLFHVQTNTLLQLWAGIVITWQVDGTSEMTLNCADGMYPITQVYPPRTVSRQCWKPFDKDVVPGYRPCPYTAQNTGMGDKTSCDYNFTSPNGCLSHGMSQFFGGHPIQPQTVAINDKGSGGSVQGQSGIASTSIISDSVWGKPLPEIWCNYFGSPQRAFWTNCVVLAVRDESTFENVLGIVGVGPIGMFEGMSVQTNADGYKFVVAPAADGYYPQGFKYDAYLNITNNTYLGLRQSVGNDPAHAPTGPQPLEDGNDAFCMGQSGPDGGREIWFEYDPNFSNVPGWTHTIMPLAAGTALCELRYAKDPGTGIMPSVADTHTMQVPIRYGLTGATFDVNGVRKMVTGLINPFWIAANMYFRALGIQGSDAATQLNYIVLSSITNTDGTGCADLANIWTTPIIGSVTTGYEVTPLGQQLWGYNLDVYNNTFSYAQNAQGQPTTIPINQAETMGYVTVVSNPNQEPQFMFQGAMADNKPLRDWLTEAMNCCLGYYCFEFGKLYLGCRYSAVPVDGFNVASMLYQSLVLTPIQATFEYLKINFANVELQYQADLAEYCDKDHAAYYNRLGSPLTSSMKSVGISTLSQGLRIAVSRTREEIGGILRTDQANQTIEWDNNKRATFKTTILALGTEVGEVIKITHPDLATYPGAAPPLPGLPPKPGNNPPFEAHAWPFRIKKWMLHSDWSVTIVADSCVDSMYDLTVGPQPPTGLGTHPMAPLYYPEPLGQWAPHQIQCVPQDALYPNEWNFDLAQTFNYAGDGTLLTTAVVSGCLPVNQFIPQCGSPDVKKGNIVYNTGGAIPGGTTLYLQICASLTTTVTDPNTGATSTQTRYSPPSEILLIQMPADTNLYSVTMNNVVWPLLTGGASVNGYAVFAGSSPDLICLQANWPNTALPKNVTFTGPLSRQTYAVPDYDLHILRVQATQLIHGGVLGATITNINEFNPPSVSAHDTIDLQGTDNWSGRTLAIIGRQTGNGDAPFTHFHVKTFHHDTGEYELDRDPTAGPNPVQVGDVFVVCFLGNDNTGERNVIWDEGLINSNNTPPHTGETPHDPTRIGQMVRVIAGTSRGMSAKITDNDAAAYYLDRALPIDSTSVWIVTDPGWIYSKDVVVDNADPNKTTQCAVPINNYLGIQLLVEGVTVDANGGIVDDTNACVRMLYIPGVQGTLNVTTDPAAAGRRKTVLAR